MKWCLIVVLTTLSSKTMASNVSLDTIVVSTIAAQSSSSVIFSSYVYMATGSSLTLQGAGGYITTASSVNAAAFFGDGSNLTGVDDAVRRANNIFTGANTFVSSFTVQSGGNQVVLSTSTSVNNIAINSAGAITFFPELHNSSSAIIPTYSTTNSNFGPCVNGSTVTIITTGGRVELNYDGQAESYPATGGISASRPGINFLQDGQYVAPLSPTIGIAKIFSGNAGYLFGMISFDYILNAPSSGTHSYCLTFRSEALGGTNTSTLANDTYRTNLFTVQELK